MTAQAITQRFIQAIDHLSKEKGKTVKEICEGLPFTPQYVTRIRSLNISIGSVFVAALYKKHGINPMWILTGEGNMFTEKGIKQRIRSEKAILESLEAKIDKIKEIQGDVIKVMLEALISVNVLPTDVQKKLAELGKRKTN